MTVHLLRLGVARRELLLFGRNASILGNSDSDFGYLLHSWLKAVFGPHAPKPFYFDETRGILYGYTAAPADELLEHAQAFADPLAYRVLAQGDVATKPMPTNWHVGKLLRLHVRACPASRKEAKEKDVFLRAIDRWIAAGGSASEKPTRGDVYLDWFRRQVADQGIELLHVELQGLRARVALLRKGTVNGKRYPREVERPEAHYSALVRIADGERFALLLRRGIGRHRAFGYGMVRVLPAS